jgi:hypothetical protein
MHVNKRQRLRRQLGSSKVCVSRAAAVQAAAQEVVVALQGSAALVIAAAFPAIPVYAAWRSILVLVGGGVQLAVVLVIRRVVPGCLFAPDTNTPFAMSSSIVLACPTDASLKWLVDKPTLARRCGRGRPPHHGPLRALPRGHGSGTRRCVPPAVDGTSVGSLRGDFDG